MKQTLKFLVTGAALLLGATPLVAQMPGAKIATVAAKVTPAAIAPGGKGVLHISVMVAPQFHINAHKPNDSSLIPTAFSGQGTGGIKYGAPQYPSPKSIKVSYETKPMLVYMGKATIAVPFTVPKTAKSGHITLGGSLNYQGCNASSCFPPASLPVKATVTIK